jgi:hypothetical protein
MFDTWQLHECRSLLRLQDLSDVVAGGAISGSAPLLPLASSVSASQASITISTVATPPTAEVITSTNVSVVPPAALHVALINVDTGFIPAPVAALAPASTAEVEATTNMYVVPPAAPHAAPTSVGNVAASVGNVAASVGNVPAGVIPAGAIPAPLVAARALGARKTATLTPFTLADQVR